MASPEQVATPEKEPQPTPELLAPPGWQKKIASAKKGGTPSKRDVFFVAPTGEEVKSKRTLDQYLKKHPGGPAASEFDWGTGETPTRRSSRLSSKTRPSPGSSEGGSGGKRAKKKVEEEHLKDDEEMAEAGEPASELPPSNLKSDEATEEKNDEKIEAAGDSPPLPDEVDDVKDAQIVVEQMEKSEIEVTKVVAHEDEKKGDVEVIPTEEKAAGEVHQSPTEKDKQGDASHNGGTPIVEDVHEEVQKKEECEKLSTGCQQCPEAQNAPRPSVGVST